MFPFFVIDHGIWKNWFKRQHPLHSLINLFNGCRPRAYWVPGYSGDSARHVALSWKPHTSGEMGHCHWSHRHGSLLERAGSDQVPGRASGDGTGMCAVKQESRTGRLGGSCKGSVAPGSRVVWRCWERLQKLLDQTPRGLQGHVEEGGEPVTGPWELPEKVAPFPGQDPAQRARERGMSSSPWASGPGCASVSVCVCVCTLCEYPNAVSESRACVSPC